MVGPWLGVKNLLVFKADLNEVPREHFNRKKAAIGDDLFWDIPFSMLMQYKSASLEFWLEVGGKPRGKGSVQYNHEAPQS